MRNAHQRSELIGNLSEPVGAQLPERGLSLHIKQLGTAGNTPDDEAVEGGVSRQVGHGFFSSS